MVQQVAYSAFINGINAQVYHSSKMSRKWYHAWFFESALCNLIYILSHLKTKLLNTFKQIESSTSVLQGESKTNVNSNYGAIF